MQKSVVSPVSSATPLLQWLVVLAILATIAVNALANLLPIAGRRTGEISDGFSSFFTPVGYVFAIWGG